MFSFIGTDNFIPPDFVVAQGQKFFFLLIYLSHLIATPNLSSCNYKFFLTSGDKNR